MKNNNKNPILEEFIKELKKATKTKESFSMIKTCNLTFEFINDIFENMLDNMPIYDLILELKTVSGQTYRVSRKEYRDRKDEYEKGISRSEY